MTFKSCFPIVTIFLLMTVATVSGQTPAQDRADALRLQLEEVKTKQLDLETRLKDLEEQSTPENIEKSLAGVGSTKPEELRELKRKKLDAEKQGVQKQLALLNDSRTRLESGIAQAEAAAYQESAKGPAVVTPLANSSDSVSPAQKQRPRRVQRKRARTRRSSSQ